MPLQDTNLYPQTADIKVLKNQALESPGKEAPNINFEILR